MKTDLEDFNDGITLLHGDNTHLIFFVDPDEEVLGVIVEDTTGIWPVATATGRKEEGRVWLLKKKIFNTMKQLGNTCFPWKYT